MRWPVVALFLAGLLPTGGEGTAQMAPSGSGEEPEVRVGDSVPDLGSLLEPDYILQDRNGDGHVDFVHARLVVPAQPSVAEVTTAANLAARLGFETYATDLDLVVRDGAGDPSSGEGVDAPVLVVGDATEILATAGVAPGSALRDLAPGEGAVQYLPPSGALPAGGAWLAGADATGLLAVGDYLAGRYPGVWDAEGPSHREVADGVRTYLEEGGAPVEEVRLERAVLSATRPGVARLEITVRVPDARERRRAVELLSVESPEREEEEEEEGETDPRSLLVPGLHRLDVVVTDREGDRELRRLRPVEPWTPEQEAAWEVRDVPDLSLARLYTVDGLFRDTDGDLLPDRSDVYVSLQGSGAAEEVVNAAQRLGLETTGIRLPLVRPAGQDERPQEAGVPILMGTDHPVTRRLAEEGLLALPTGADGEGFVEFVSEALDGRHALVVAGTDEAGLGAAARLLARRIPYLHEPERGRRKGSYELEEVEREVRRFFQARSSSGKVALAMRTLERWLERLERGERPGVHPSNAPWPEGPDPDELLPLEEIRLELAVDTVPPGLDEVLAARLSERFPGVEAGVELHSVGLGLGDTVETRESSFGWEVDRVREILSDEVYPALVPDPEGASDQEEGPGSVEVPRLEVRVSEPPEVRRMLEAEIRDSLRVRGVDGEEAEVTVLSAYKQGFSWIEDRVLPELRRRGFGGEDGGGEAPALIEISYHHLQESEEVPWQVIGSDTRWLQELFPIDAVLARELGIPDSLVVFRATRSPDPVYRVRVRDEGGAVVLEDAFTPSYVVDPYFHLHPDYERVRISTGWLRAETGGVRLVDRRIRTDLERFWDWWQGEILPLVRDYVLDLQEGEVSPGNAPYFDELAVEVRLSEPDHRIGIDEEVISSLESLHNDLYFHTLAFLGHLGQHYGVGSLNYPGRILPRIDPGGEGEGGRARVRFVGRERDGPELVLRTRQNDREWGRWRYSLSPLPAEGPALKGMAATAGREGLDRLLLELTAVDSLDRWEEHRERASEEAIDRNLLSVELLEGMAEQVRSLRGHGLLEGALAFEGVDELQLRFLVEDAEEYRRTVSVPVGANPAPTRHPVLAAPGWRHEGERLVQWDEPLSPAESDSILARLGTLPRATVYFAGRSLLGRNVFVADMLPPIEGELVSQARLNALRPTLFLSGRQHANEVSSTSHILRLGELLATDPEYQELLRGVNVVLHPVTNPDGAQLAWERQRVNPDFTLHSGYLGALGVDATAGAGSEDPVYPESQVRPRIMSTWLPDIYLNLHGYPSHEWVQHFSGYAAWVRGRPVVSRTWWAPRGWFIPGFTWVDDPDHPEITEAQFAILDTIAAAVTGVPEVREMSERQYARYAKYGKQDVDGFREYFHEGMLVYLSLRGREVSGSGPGNPRINTFSATTEAPDETARGDWLELVATAGLAHTSALAGYLAGGASRVERKAETFDGWIVRKVYRTRPVLPPDGEEERPDEGGG